MNTDFVQIDPIDNNQILASGAIKYELLLREETDPQALLDAAVKTRACYDILQVRVRVTDDKAHFVKNDLPLKLLHIAHNEAVRFGCESTNHYPWFVSCDGRLITICVSHGLTDGKGLTEMTRTLMYFYAKNIGLDIPDSCGIITENIRDDLLPSSYCCGFNPDEEPLPTYPLEKATLIDRTFLDGNYGADLHFTKLKIDSAQFMDKVKELNTTPFALLSLLFFRGMKALMSTDEPVIQAAVLVSLRAVFGIETMHNFVDARKLQYDSRVMDKLTDDVLCTIFRSRLDLMLDRSGSIQGVRKLLGFSQWLESVVPFAKRQQVYVDTINSTTGPDSDVGVVFWLSYIGQLGLPEGVAELIEDVDFHLDCKLIGTPLMIEVVDHHGCFYVNCMHHLRDNTLFDGICKQLDCYHIGYALNETIEQAHFGLDISD